MSGIALAGPKVEFDTSKGKIVIELNEEKAPKTVKNFLQYVDDGFYTNIAFHRVISDFMIQVGGFEEKDGKITKKATRDPIENEANNGLKNEKGTLAMARTGDPHSASAQFFINHKDNDFLNHTSEDQRAKTDFLDGKHVVFGSVVEGMDVVKKVESFGSGGGETSKTIMVKDCGQLDAE
ncbi:UNVERIFIED_CONTAM: hypothetical protein GTU68_055828 [Idotea baltica]|nr:hypothetical protein [Idotea baltica]